MNEQRIDRVIDEDFCFECHARPHEENCGRWIRDQEITRLRARLAALAQAMSIITGWDAGRYERYFLPTDIIAGAKKIKDRLSVVSRTYGELPEQLQGLLPSHEWDNKTPSEQRDWTLARLQVALTTLAAVEAARDVWIKKTADERLAGHELPLVKKKLDAARAALAAAEADTDRAHEMCLGAMKHHDTQRAALVVADEMAELLLTLSDPEYVPRVRELAKGTVARFQEARKVGK